MAEIRKIETMQPTLLVMAAGMGSRYGGLKQIDAVGPHGEAIIDYSIHDALRAGFERLVFVIRRDIEDLGRINMNDRISSLRRVADRCGGSGAPRRARCR